MLMAKLVLKESDIENIVRKTVEEIRDHWREAEDNYLMQEKLPKGWTKAPQVNPDDEPLYYDEEGRAWVKDDYGHGFKCIEEPEDDEMDLMNESYGITIGGGKLLSNKAGWGPRFTTFPQDAKAFSTPGEAEQYIAEYLGDMGASVVSIPGEDEEDLYESVKATIKNLIKEEFNNFGMGPVYGMEGPSQFEVTKKSKHFRKEKPQSDVNRHYKAMDKEKRKSMGKGGGKVSKGKRSIVLKWLKDPAVNCAEIMRKLWNPDTNEEDAARSYFYKCRDGKLNDSGVPYKFSDAEINELYKIKAENS